MKWDPKPPASTVSAPPRPAPWATGGYISTVTDIYKYNSVLLQLSLLLCSGPVPHLRTWVGFLTLFQMAV
jgi:hypothetical protein